MTEYIEKGEAIERLSRLVYVTNVFNEYNTIKGNGWTEGRGDAMLTIATIPPADVAPVVHAHWIKDECAFMRCSQCGYENDWEWATPYCPSCGARMGGEEG